MRWNYDNENASFDDLIGKTLTDVKFNNITDDEIVFTCSDGTKYIMGHVNECCENVFIKDVVGEFSDLIGTPIVKAYESSNSGNIEYGIEAWTFYNISTIKGNVQIAWYGSSNGYYSVGVSFLMQRKESDFCSSCGGEVEHFAGCKN